MVHRQHVHLSRRERQIMDVLYARQEATAAAVQEAIPDAPTYSTVRALLQRLVEKGHVQHRQDGPRYLYRPALGKSAAADSAQRRLVDIFFGGSAADAVVNLLGREALTAEDLEKVEDALARLRSKKARGGRRGR